MAEEKKAVVPQQKAAAVKKTSDKPKRMARIKKWFRDMKSELKKVVWPTPKQTMKNTGVALVVIVVCALVLWAFDQAAQRTIQFVISRFA